MKATEEYFSVVLFTDVWLEIKASGDTTTGCYAVQGGSDFWISGLNSHVWPLKLKATE